MAMGLDSLATGLDSLAMGLDDRIDYLPEEQFVKVILVKFISNDILCEKKTRRSSKCTRKRKQRPSSRKKKND